MTACLFLDYRVNYQGRILGIFYEMQISSKSKSAEFNGWFESGNLRSKYFVFVP